MILLVFTIYKSTFCVVDFPGGAIPGFFFFLISFLSSLGPSPSSYFLSCLLHLGTWHLLCPLSVLEGVFSFHILMFPHTVFDLEIYAVTKPLVVLFCSHLTRCHLVSSLFYFVACLLTQHHFCFQ